MMTALQQQLVTAPTKSLFNFFNVGIDIRYICVCMTRDSVKITKLAIGNTNVGCINISVDLPCNLTVTYLFLPEPVSNIHDFTQRSMLKKRHTFGYGQELKSQCFFVQIRQIHFRVTLE